MAPNKRLIVKMNGGSNNVCECMCSLSKWYTNNDCNRWLIISRFILFRVKHFSHFWYIFYFESQACSDELMTLDGRTIRWWITERLTPIDCVDLDFCSVYDLLLGLNCMTSLCPLLYRSCFLAITLAWSQLTMWFDFQIWSRMADLLYFHWDCFLVLYV